MNIICEKYSKFNVIIKIILVVLIFCLIYAPRFFSFNTLHLLFIISVLLSPFFLRELIPLIKKTIIVKFCVSYFLIVLYSTLIAYFGGESVTATNLIVVPIELGICVLFILAIMQWRNMKSKDLIDIILCVGIIQSLICCAMVFSPDLRAEINEFRAQFWDDRLIGWSKTRLLGFADGLFHTTPIIQAIISILLIKKAEKNSYMYIFVITTLVSALLNSRTSFVVWVLCLFYYFFSGSNSNKGKIRTLIFLGCSTILISSLIIAILNEYAIGAMDYFYSGMDEIGAASQGKKIGFFEYLNRYLTFPHGLDFLFGIGCDTYGKINNPDYYYIHTDYGFVNDVWIYGFIGAGLIIILYLDVISNCLKLKNDYSKLITGCLFISFVIGHFKGIITYYNDYTAFLLLVSTSTGLDYCRKKNNTFKLYE